MSDEDTATYLLPNIGNVLFLFCKLFFLICNMKNIVIGHCKIFDALKIIILNNPLLCVHTEEKMRSSKSISEIKTFFFVLCMISWKCISCIYMYRHVSHEKSFIIKKKFVSCVYLLNWELQSIKHIKSYIRSLPYFYIKFCNVISLQLK